MASLTDKLTDTRNAARPNSAKVNSPRTTGASTLVCDNLTGWPTASKVHFVTYKIDSSSAVVSGTQLDCYGIVSGNSITSLTVVDGSDVGHAVNDVVEMLPTAAWGQDLVDALTAQHTRTGTHKSVTTDTLSTTGAASVGGTLAVAGVLTPAGGLSNASVIPNNLIAATGTSWAWTAFIPTFNLTGGGSWGNGTFAGNYRQIGKDVSFWAKFTLGSTTNFSGLTAITLNYPVTPSANVLGAVNWPLGSVYMQKPSVAINLGRAYGNSTNINVWAEVVSGTYNAPADITSTIPFAWAVSSVLVVYGSYEAA